MCQLTFIHTEVNLKKKLLVNQLYTNSLISHKDGWGFYEQDKIIKSQLCASLTINLGEIVNKYIKTADPVIAHVRLKSTGTKVSKKSAHPFETEDFVLAHNGTLDYKDYDTRNKWEGRRKNKNYKEVDEDTIDSQIFLLALQEEYSKNKDKKSFSEIISKTMKGFSGKFAFLIYAKQEKNYYIVRGRTADLHISYIKRHKKKIGVIINTEELPLEKSILRTNILMQAEGKGELEFSEPENLDEETVYLYHPENYSLSKVGDIKQNYTAVVASSYQKRSKKTKRASYNNGYNQFGAFNQEYNKAWEKEEKEEEEFKRVSQSIFSFMSKAGISLKELEALSHIIFGSSLISLSMEDFILLEEEFIPKLSAYTSEAKKEIWREILKEKNIYSYKLYKRKNFHFPYFLNSFGEIVETKAEILEEMEKELQGGK